MGAKFSCEGLFRWFFSITKKVCTKVRIDGIGSGLRVFLGVEHDFGGYWDRLGTEIAGKMGINIGFIAKKT